MFRIAGHNGSGCQLSLARLRWALYCRNLLRNPTFLEASNLVDAFARSETRKRAWVGGWMHCRSGAYLPSLGPTRPGSNCSQ